MQASVSRPYLSEQISVSDKFSITGFFGLLALIGVFGLWVWSAMPLLGGFAEWMGIFGNKEVLAVADLTSTPTVNSVGWYSIDQVDMNTGVITPTPIQMLDPTPYPTYTPYPTPIPKVKLAWPTIAPEGSQAKNNDNYDTNLMYVYDDYYRTYISNREPDRVLDGKYSYFYPPYGGINCDIQYGKEECIYMASGEVALDWYGVAWACDASIPFQSIIYIRELDLYGICKDRGGAIKLDDDGLYWFDHLHQFGLLFWSEKITVEVYENK